MRRLAFSAATLFSLFLAACGTDNVSPNNGQAPGEAVPLPGPALAAGTCSATYNTTPITADIDSLMKVLTPNNSSAQSKWDYVKPLMSYGNPDSTPRPRRTPRTR